MRATSWPPRCADGSTAPRAPAGGCERSAPPTSTSHSPSPDCFAPRSPRIPPHSATQNMIERPQARTQHTPLARTPSTLLVRCSTKPKPPVYWILASGPERRLPPGQRCTAWPACFSMGRYPRTPQPSDSRPTGGKRASDRGRPKVRRETKVRRRDCAAGRATRLRAPGQQGPRRCGGPRGMARRKAEG